MVHKVDCLETSKPFQGHGTKIIAVDNMRTTFNKEEFTAIMESCGSGKSNSLSLIGTLGKPMKEKITCDNEDPQKKVLKHIDEFWFNKIEFIFHLVHLPPTLTPLENVLTPLFLQRFPYKKVERAYEVQSQVELSNKLESDVIFVTYDSVLVAKVGAPL